MDSGSPDSDSSSSSLLSSSSAPSFSAPLASSSGISSSQPHDQTSVYGIEDVRPHGGIPKFQSAAYSNCLKKPS